MRPVPTTRPVPHSGRNSTVPVDESTASYTGLAFVLERRVADSIQSMKNEVVTRTADKNTVTNVDSISFPLIPGTAAEAEGFPVSGYLILPIPRVRGKSMTESEFLISLEEEAKDTLTKRGMKKLLSEETGARISIELVPDEPSARYVEKSQLSGNKDIRIRMNRKYVEKAMEDRNYADAVRLMVGRSLAYSVIEAAEVGRIRR